MPRPFATWRSPAGATNNDLVERYAKEQGLFRLDGDPEPTFSELLDLDLSAVVPSMAGPKRPQDRVALPDVWDSFVGAFRDHLEPDPKGTEIGRFVAEGGTPRQEALPGDSDVTSDRRRRPMASATAPS